MRESLNKLFHQRWFAIALCLVCVVASTLLNTRVKLGGQCEDMIESFYESSGDTLSIGSQLKSICNAATGLTSIAAHYSLDSSAANTANEQLQSDMKNAPEAVGALYADYQELLGQTEELIGRLEQASLSKRDAENLELYTSAIDVSCALIEESSYNTEVSQFRRANARFPAPTFAALAGVAMPQLFQ